MPRMDLSRHTDLVWLVASCAENVPSYCPRRLGSGLTLEVCELRSVNRYGAYVYATYIALGPTPFYSFQSRMGPDGVSHLEASRRGNRV